ncbi:MAG: urea ABC transporter permease subunit UrtB, partial [Betaproteobacteria bacterium]
MLSLAKKAAAAAFFLVFSASTAALDPAAVEKLATGEGDERYEALAALVAEGDPKAAEILRQAAEGEIELDGKKHEVMVNNRLRAAIAEALAALQLLSPEREARFAAARALAGVTEASYLPLVKKALDQEKDAEVKALLENTLAGLQLKSGDKAARIAAIGTLAQSSHPNARTLLLEAAQDADADIKMAAQKSLREVEGRLGWGEWLGLAFAGVSLGSILLLAALGLAITYGLMGVINMAHGELIMIGAYTTYVVQGLFRNTEFFHWYLIAAVPAAFIVSGLVGIALERSVIRWLYGRPLETLLATWGISLVLMQAVRTLFGAQNVQVENPAFMSGGIQILSNVVLPWNRIWIIFFAVAVLIAMWAVLTRTRLGLHIRGVTQNRSMASCVGVPTAKVDAWAFGLGSGIAGLAGCALSQIGNVGPDLGQGYIVDSFMVVVFGGVGQLAGTVYAALVLGFANKLLESWSGAVIAKIVVLVFIIFFIQRRPQGLFA